MFRLDEQFLAPFRSRTPDMSVPAYITCLRTYAAPGESWFDTCRRVIEGTFQIYEQYGGRNLDWRWLTKWAQVMFIRMFEMKWVPAGRGLQHMGRPSMWKKGGAVLNSCAFVSTQSIQDDLAAPFAFLMDMSMLGVGVGFDTAGAGSVAITPPELWPTVHVVEDTREGWVEVLKTVLRAFAGDAALPKTFDFSYVRPEGAPLNTMGGVASGPGPLIQLVWDLFEVLAPPEWGYKLMDDGLLLRIEGGPDVVEPEERSQLAYPITSEHIGDIANIAGKCVVSGGIRRSAEIGIGLPDDRTFVDFKRVKIPLSDAWREAAAARYKYVPETRNDAWRWAANNSWVFDQPMSRAAAHAVAGSVADYGDPGVLNRWLMRTHGRLVDGPDNRDFLVMGCNPCGEQPLEDEELCNLIEICAPRHENTQDFTTTAICAYLYGKAVSLFPTHNERTNSVIRRNRRMGISQTGVFPAREKFGEKEMITRWDTAYRAIRELDVRFSKMLGVAQSVRITSLKPSGTVSLVLDVPSGLRPDEAPYYVRRIRFERTSPLVEMLKEHGYPIEPDLQSPNSVVVSFPVRGQGTRFVADVSAREQLDLVTAVQTFWSDNMVSNTIQFREHEAAELGDLIYEYRDKCKSLSFLQYDGHAYAQAPFEAVSKEQYEKMVGAIRPLDYGALGSTVTHDNDDKFCEGGTCTINGSVG